MSSDDAYMDFLNKANADHSAGQKVSTQGAKTRTVDDSLKVPSSLQQVEAYYVSESDEPFEPVVLRFKDAAKGEWPSAGTLTVYPLSSPTSMVAQGFILWGCIYERIFTLRARSLVLENLETDSLTLLSLPDDLSSLISPDADISGQISTLDTSSFDPRKEYTKVLQAVQKATEESDPDIKVYRVQRSSSTVEYYVLALDSAEGGRIVGLFAKSVET
ncbi:uncharacterized protein N7484_005035 [Penicillium longicatenatum]|uniref:uncharacterized protein n=1 Tax=Penicillium longicatenatum TaxID=1561947 RepID=UPI002547A122|nr:uncharacterized protein N7484_005035 [Penicillium longicatenatum]KAJ5651312.1 hypothetical protein N7484_005035 [Penicillium longicatenatum]